MIIDDSGCQKDQSTKKMEALDFQFSHTEGKCVWSHCLVTAHVVADGYFFAYDFRPYFRQEYCEEHHWSLKARTTWR
ncbi:hypothetical protein ACIFOT_13165 [Neobacillus sp. NRS-1170]|uniref:hypothetical protein n=1 Tax=Neobacillus sp. NRS-1170 TaxID=3233898 RepID=UPI003D27898E